nr:uncharacterized protein LOC127328460 [Lolium perenne]
MEMLTLHGDASKEGNDAHGRRHHLPNPSRARLSSESSTISEAPEHGQSAFEPLSAAPQRLNDEAAKNYKPLRHTPQRRRSGQPPSPPPDRPGTAASMLPSSRSNAARGEPRQLQAPTHVQVAPAQQAQIGPMKPRSGPHSILLSPPPGDADLAGLEAVDLCSPRLSPAELLRAATSRTSHAQRLPTSPLLRSAADLAGLRHGAAPPSPDLRRAPQSSRSPPPSRPHLPAAPPMASRRRTKGTRWGAPARARHLRWPRRWPPPPALAAAAAGGGDPGGALGFGVVASGAAHAWRPGRDIFTL